MTTYAAPCRSIACRVALAVAVLAPLACAHTMPLPLPSEFRQTEQGRLRSHGELDRVRLLEGTHRNRLRIGVDQEQVPDFAWATLTRLPVFVHSVLGAAGSAHSEQRFEDAIRLADSAVGASDHALMSREEREVVRHHAWRLQAMAWRSLGHLGRARVLATMASLAGHFDHTPEAATSSSSLAQTLDTLDEAVVARNEAAQAADEAANAAALGAALQTAATVSAAASSSSRPNLESTLRLAQEIAAPLREAEGVAREGAQAVTGVDRAIEQGVARQLASLSLEAPELAALTTPLAATVRFYLESSHGDCGYLSAAFSQLAVETRWNPHRYDRALDIIEDAADGAASCSWTPSLQAAFNLVHLNAEDPVTGRAASTRETRAFGDRRARSTTVATQPTSVALADRDDDRVSDANDRCPDDPEDPDGFEDDDGCVDPDNDHDGFGDRADRCPLEPESVNGVTDDDGCPDTFADTDGDLIPDPFDACPQAPETYDGRADDDGCPERRHALFTLEAGLVRTRRPLRVRAGRALPRDVASVLDALCIALSRFPAYRLVITASRPTESDVGALRVVQMELLGRRLDPLRVSVSVPPPNHVDEPTVPTTRHRSRPTPRTTVVLRVDLIAAPQLPSP